MKKQKFSGIILLMGISLLGIIGIQVFWMHQAISVKDEQFDQQVNQAINRAAYRIERNQNAFLLSSMFSSQPNIPLSKIQSQQYQDSIIIEFSDYLDQENDSNVILINEKNSNKVKREVKNGFETRTYGFDTVIITGNSKQHIKTYSSISTPDDHKYIYNQDNKIDDPQKIKEELSNAMNQMIMEFTLKDMPIHERLGTSVVEPTIRYELDNLEIPLHFEYAITDKKGKPLNNLISKGYKPKRGFDIYRTVMFPNSFMVSGELLSIYFPEKRNFIYGSLISLFIGSLIFTIIILFTFYYTLKTIFNQKRVSEIKTDFINNMTHEFKTPIATISLASDAISNPEIIKNPEKVTRFIDVIKEENKRMNRQVESVLKMALIDKKDFNLQITEVNAHSLIEKAVNNISLQVEQKNGVIHKRLEAISDILKVDETHFVNIIYNLLDNANKYTLDKTPVIEISTFTQGEYFNIAVSDNGIGMDTDTRKHVFEKFYRYSTGNVHTVKGFGLGLSYVRAVVMALKGEISIKSEKGKGSTFTIKIPY